MSPPQSMKPLLARLASGEPLSEDEAATAFTLIMNGEASEAQIGAFLMGLRVRGETVEEITAGARVMRAKAAMIEAPPGTIDTCGTGGDSSGTFNVSTAAAFVVAACGVPVAKHGNRAVSSKSGSADVLSALGVNIDADAALVARCLREQNICFLMATRHNAAARHVATVREQLGVRTVFNLLGPLANPAGARRQLVGVYDRRWLVPLAHVLGRLGAERAWVVHGSDGLDELTVCGTSMVAEWRGGEVVESEVDPRWAGLSLWPEAALKGGDADCNAAALQRLLDGEKGAYRDIVVLNAGAALMLADRVKSLPDGVKMAQDAIDSGAARERLRRLIDTSNEGKPA